MWEELWQQSLHLYVGGCGDFDFAFVGLLRTKREKICPSRRIHTSLQAQAFPCEPIRIIVPMIHI
jgi:hypothetical protein